MLATIDASMLDHPRLRENVWQVTPDEPVAFVETADGCYEIPTGQAIAFLRIRSHCTPYNTVGEIAARSDVPVSDVAAMLGSLRSIGVLGERAPRPVIDRLRRIVALWSSELARDFIGNALLDEALPRTVLTGWLLETYHYVRDFPDAIAAAAARTPEGALRYLLECYADEERGHERFVIETLENIGLSRCEVIDSRPLVSTRLIGLLMRDLFAVAPASVLLMAALIEAQDVPDGSGGGAQALMETRYELEPGALAPYFLHQTIDAQLGHQKLFEDNLACFDIVDPDVLDAVVDKLHDLKHAFDLQGMEIRRYYGTGNGAYLPRQPMSFGAI